MELAVLGVAVVKLLTEALKAYNEVKAESKPKATLPPPANSDVIDNLVTAYTQRISYLEQDRDRLREENRRLQTQIEKEF